MSMTQHLKLLLHLLNTHNADKSQCTHASYTSMHFQKTVLPIFLLTVALSSAGVSRRVTGWWWSDDGCVETGKCFLFPLLLRRRRGCNQSDSRAHDAVKAASWTSAQVGGRGHTLRPFTTCYLYKLAVQCYLGKACGMFLFSYPCTASC